MRAARARCRDACAGSSRRPSPKVSTLGVEEQRVNVVVDVISPSEQWAGLGDAYQVNAGRAGQRAVQVLRRSNRFAAVSAGLTPGERVIVYLSDRVAPGVRVEAK